MNLYFVSLLALGVLLHPALAAPDTSQHASAETPSPLTAEHKQSQPETHAAAGTAVHETAPTAASHQSIPSSPHTDTSAHPAASQHKPATEQQAESHKSTAEESTTEKEPEEPYKIAEESQAVSIGSEHTDPTGNTEKLSEQMMENIGLLSSQQKQEEIKMEELEEQYQKEEEKQEKQQLEPWLAEQERLTSQAEHNHVRGENFEFTLQPGSYQSFYYDTTNNKPNNDIHIDVQVYIEENSTFYLPNHPEKAAGVSIAFVNPQAEIVLEKHVYASLSFEFRPPRNTGYHINFFNNYNAPTMILVNIERLGKAVETIQDAHLDPLSQTLKGVFDEMQTSFNEQMKYMYKSELGFKEKQEQHQSTMLMLTGLELLAVIVTAVTQMFCLRSLLDNRSIV